jgi:V/A-type H+-transporting ATPase subunit A
VIPGGFGTGKTVVEQQLARWSDADIVVYVGCGERGNEMAELLTTFPELVDPRTGRPLLERTVLVANTSNMPVAAREASIQLGITIAEYFRDQGLAVALLADSTSRWAEALREIGGRLEELPGEEGYPAYLPSRLAAFYERAGAAVVLGTPEREGSVTIVAAVSPPGGDFSEPVTQASLRLGATFWALDTTLAHARQFPAVNPLTSYSLSVGRLARWMREATGGDWLEARAAALDLLARERALLDIVALVGADALPDRDRVVLEIARLLREVVLAQHAFDPVDAARPPDVGFALLQAVLAAKVGFEAALAAGVPFDRVRGDPLLDELRAAKRWSGPDVAARLRDLAARLEGLGRSIGGGRDGPSRTAEPTTEPTAEPTAEPPTRTTAGPPPEPAAPGPGPTPEAE